MLVELINNIPSGVINISNKEKEDEFLINNPTYMKTDFKFTESLDFYEFDGTTFDLVADWETIKSQREADEEARILAEIEANKPTFEELQTQMIKTLHSKYDKAFQEYLDQYPIAEQKSFITKANEARDYMADNTAPTPYVSGLAGGDETKRVALLNAIWIKVKTSALNEGNMIAARDKIKACETIEELEALGV